ncbi:MULTISPECIES: hypothetical protein [unclassified Streptomyces]|uniref:hypothetical protein n=1 Tax=unclassified Streptomyces TaxID=2593676 RepID=UPI0036781ACC
MSVGDTAVIAVFAACGGCVTVLAGLTGLCQTRRVERTGVRTWALVKRNFRAPGESPSSPRPLAAY